MVFPSGINLEFSDIFGDVEFCYSIRKGCNDTAKVMFVWEKTHRWCGNYLSKNFCVKKCYSRLIQAFGSGILLCAVF